MNWWHVVFSESVSSLIFRINILILNFYIILLCYLILLKLFFVLRSHWVNSFHRLTNADSPGELSQPRYSFLVRCHMTRSHPVTIVRPRRLIGATFLQRMSTFILYLEKYLMLKWTHLVFDQILQRRRNTFPYDFILSYFSFRRR